MYMNLEDENDSRQVTGLVEYLFVIRVLFGHGILFLGSEALAPRLPLRVLNLCDTSATPLCLWVPHLHKLFASKRFCSSSSSPELCLHRLYALPSGLRLRSMPLLNLLGKPAGSSSASP
ncbi:hypothetical protein YC2023_015522 [Brassica napus]